MAGALYTMIGLVVMKVGYAWIERLMPPAVTGAVVAVIGLNLAPIAVKGISGGSFETWIGHCDDLAVGLVAGARAGPCAAAADSASAAIIGYLPLRRARPTSWASASRSTSRRVVGGTVDRLSAPRIPGMERAGDHADRAGRDRAGRREPGPREGGRRDDRPESRSLSRPRIPRRRHRHHGRGRGRRHRRDHVRGEHRRHGGNPNLLDPRVRRRRAHGDRARVLAQVRRADHDHSRAGAGRSRHRGVRSHHRHRAAASGSRTRSIFRARGTSSRSRSR